jgi:hypothetical protein
MYNDDDYISGIDMAESMGAGGFPDPKVAMLRLPTRRRPARPGMRRSKFGPVPVAWRSAGPRGLSGEDTSYSLSTPGGVVSLTDAGLSYTKTPAASGPAPVAVIGPAGKAIAFVQKNPLILAGGLLALVLILKRRK